METIICDTDVMIDYLDRRNTRHADTYKALKEIGLDNVALSAITKMELIAGLKDKTDFTKLRKNIGFFDVLSIDHEITLIAVPHGNL